jgi:hypothetical protein
MVAGAVVGAEIALAACMTEEGRCSTLIRSLWQRMKVRSTTFSSSRTFPGNGYAISRAIASRSTPDRLSRGFANDRT